MNGNLDKLIIEATKFLKIARYILILWVIVYVLVVVIGTLGVFGAGYRNMSQLMQTQMIEPE